MILSQPLELMLTVVGLVSMFVGNLWALRAKDWKGVLRASFLVHTGLLTVGVAARGEVGRASVLLYLFAFVAMSVGAWTAVGSAQGGGGKGRGWDNPLRGFAMGLFLFSLSGVPLTMGFIARLHLVSAMVRDVNLIVVVVVLLNLLVCFYCYGKLFLDLFASPASPDKEAFETGRANAVTLLVGGLLVIGIGVWPEPWLSVVTQVAREFF
jgi:NADH-quinone oxidoreductase subunit N